MALALDQSCWMVVELNPPLREYRTEEHREEGTTSGVYFLMCKFVDPEKLSYFQIPDGQALA